MKSPWEARVGTLLDSRHHPEFKYSFKPYDSPGYGGQPRIDWHAADYMGRYWLIEVKSLPESRVSFNMTSEISPGQTQALTAMGDSHFGVPLLVIGQGRMAYFFLWRQIAWRAGHPSSYLLPLGSAPLQLAWSPKSWQSLDLMDMLQSKSGFSLEPMTSGPLSAPPALFGPMPTAPTPVRIVVKAPVPPTLPPGLPRPDPGAPVGSLWGIPVILSPSASPLPGTPVPESPSTSKPSTKRQQRKKLLERIPSPGG